MRKTIIALIAFLTLCDYTLCGRVLEINYPFLSPRCRFAATEIVKSAVEKGYSVVEGDITSLSDKTNDLRIVIVYGDYNDFAVINFNKTDEVKLSKPESYLIRRILKDNRENIVVFGYDEVGAMYGGLDLAEAIRLNTINKITNSNHSPFVEKRGIKFNIPLDLRTPSYSDCGDSFQQNIPEIWSMDFWSEFLDEMARNRYNVLTLWNLHPFPSLVRVPEYPETALNDVWRTKEKLDDSFSFTGTDMVRQNMLKNYEVVKKISIDEKIQFWRNVMQYAYDRGIEVYLFTWNIFVWGTDGKYGITTSQTNKITIDYFKRSVRETVLTYPLLAGIGITAGENMQNRTDEFSKEKWLWETYGRGILEAKKLNPQRKIRLIHRYHMSNQKEILDAWKDYPDEFDFSFKYAIAHMYSSPAPPFIKSALPYIPQGMKTWLTVRNDDIYSFRWADPEYVRAFVTNFPSGEKFVGFYMGPDGYCWGREFLSKNPKVPRELVMKKQWLSFMLWGRLSYNPQLSDELFLKWIEYKFPEVDAEQLFTALRQSSKIIPQVTRFFWQDIDLKWFPEACLSHPRHKGFYTVQHFIEGQTMPSSGIMNILDYRDALLNKKVVTGITPAEVAENLKNYSHSALRIISEVKTNFNNASVELRETIGDIKAVSYLGEYYSEKIVGAINLALYDATGDENYKSAAIEQLRSALRFWINYADCYDAMYKSQLLNRVGYVNLKELTGKVENDIEIAKNWKIGTIKRKTKPEGMDVPFRP
ncbi:MAG: carbohydrate-binding family 6 protein [Verrucomicrobiia bacterium]